MRAEMASAGDVDLGWPAEDLFDSEEQDEPLAGQDHRDTIDSLYYPLRGRLAGPACYVAAELRVHRDEHNHRDYREPDILVALGVADAVRPYYSLWEEPKAPDLVLEVLSPSSAENKDLTLKRDWYRREGVREYVVLDPSGDFLPEPLLQAWRLGARPDGTLLSELIPFGWRVVDGCVRVVDRVTGELLPPIWDAEPQLRREVQLRREAQEQTQLAQEQIRLAREEARAARDETRQALERADREATVRRALEEELARLRGH